MYSQSKIVEMFRAMGLGSAEERKRFETMRSLPPQGESEEAGAWFLISGSCTSTDVCGEEGDAELEGNP